MDDPGHPRVGGEHCVSQSRSSTKSGSSTIGAAIRFEAAIAGKRPEEIPVLEQTRLRALSS